MLCHWDGCHVSVCIFSRLVHTYVKKLGLTLNNFIHYNDNAWYLVNGQRYRMREVKANPEILGYYPTEKGDNAETLSHQSTANVPPASPLPGLGENRVWPEVTTQVSGWTQSPDSYPTLTLIGLPSF